MNSFLDLAELENILLARAGKKQGNEIIFQCPMHNDNNPSASYNTEKNVWYCFGCGESGHVQEREGLAVLLGIRQPDIYEEWTIEEKEAYAKVLALKQEELDAKRKEGKTEAVTNQRKRFEEAHTQYKLPNEGESSLYCYHKGIPSFEGVHHYGSMGRTTYLPIINIDSKIIAYQKIYRERIRELKFAKITCGPSKGGMFFLQNKELKAKLPEALEGVICFCEGFSTGCSIHLATNYPVVCTVSAQTMKIRVKEVLGHYPNAKAIICADNDANKTPNTGLEVAKATAYEFRLKFCFPKELEQGIKIDFNDLHNARGLEAVKNIVMSAKKIYSYPTDLRMNKFLKHTRKIRK